MRCVYFLLLIIVMSCQLKKEENGPLIANEPELLAEIELSFVTRGITGCFILYDLENDKSLIYNPSRAHQSFLPASTFKILNSMIALENEVVSDENEIIQWDGVERPIMIWNKDHNMRSGIRYSVVWFYQELARRIGQQRMQQWVDSVGYGNQRIGKEIDNFWLVGDLRISPLEQVEFLKKVIEEDLPFKKPVIKTVKEILVEDQTSIYTFRAKTGWATQGIPVGWYVGYLEMHGKTFVFVNNMEIKESGDADARKKITKEVFHYAFNIDLDI